MNKTFVIGLGHTKRVGKDTFAHFLMDELSEQAPHVDVIKSSFAHKLKSITHELYRWAGLMPPEFYETPKGEKLREVILPELDKSPRQIWIDFGTTAVRNQVYERTWVDYLLKNNLGTDLLIVTDVRFPNEAISIQDMGGVLIKVVRDGFPPGKDVADQALIDFNGWNYIIGAGPNSLQNLRDNAKIFATEIARTGRLYPIKGRVSY